MGVKLGESYNVQDMMVTCSYGGEVLYGLLDAGISVKYMSSTLETHAATAFGADMGVLYKAIPDKLDIGITLQNAGTSLKFRDEGDPLPLTVKCGAGYRVNFAEDEGYAINRSSLLSEKNITFFTDVNYLRDAGMYANAGMEINARYSETASLSLRGGYRTDLKRQVNGLSFGLGFKNGIYGIDYSFSPLGDLGQAHRVALSLAFSQGE